MRFDAAITFALHAVNGIQLLLKGKGGLSVFKRGLRMRDRLMLSFAVVLLLFLAGSAWLARELAVVRTFQEEERRQQNRMMLAEDLQQTALELNLLLSDVWISRDASRFERFDPTAARLKTLVDAIGDTAATPDERKWRAQLRITAEEFIGSFERTVREIETISDPEQAGFLMRQAYTLAGAHREMLFELSHQFAASYADAARRAQNRTQDALRHAVFVAWAVPLLTALVAAFASGWLIRTLMQPVRALMQAASRVADGDLAHRIDVHSDDELGRLSDQFDRMAGRLSELLSRIHGVAATLAEHASAFDRFASSTAQAHEDIVRAVGEIASGAERQAAEAERGFEQAKRSADHAERLLDSAEQMRRLSEETVQASIGGAAAIADLEQAAERTDEALAALTEDLERLVADSAHIGKIVSAISGISAQTHLLALNASIEAARAGHEHAGFAVIADEVRKLAEETTQAAKTVGEQLRGMSRRISDARAALGRLSGRGAEQAERLKRTKAAFAAVESAMTELSGQIDRIREQIGRASEENRLQRSVAETIAQLAETAVAHAEEVSSAAASQHDAVRELAGRAASLTDLAQTLFTEVGVFRLRSKSKDIVRPSQNKTHSSEKEESDRPSPTRGALASDFA